jgi:flagellin
MSVINTNVKSLVAQDAIMKNNRALSTSMQRLSTGSRINSAKDDAAGLAISTRMDSQVRGLSMAIKNANDGISLLQTAEGAMDEVTNILQRMRELSVQSVNGTNNDSDRVALNDEITQLKSEIDRIASTTEFNNQKIINGTFTDKKLQIGDKSYQTMQVDIGSVSTKDLGMASGSFDGQTLVGNRVALTAFDEGDVMINGQELAKFDPTTAKDDLEDLIQNINENVDNVTASGFNTVVAKQVGTGITTDGQFKIQVQALGATAATTYSISASSNMQELVDNINNEAGAVVQASINDQGKLVLSNNTGATIKVADGSSSTSGSYETASGFKRGATAAAYTSFAGFLKLDSDDGNPIRIEVGNRQGNTPGKVADLESLGFREVSSQFNKAQDAYTVTGDALTSAGVTTAWGQTDIKINGVAIYDADIDTKTFQGKLDAINNLSEQTGVIAYAQLDKTFTFSAGSLSGLSGNEKISFNGVEVASIGGTSVTLASLATAMNTKTGITGVTAEVDGFNLRLTGSNVQSLKIDVGYALGTAKATAVFSDNTQVYAGIRLDSASNSPISIELGEDAAVAEHGFLEQNVGAADFQVNAAALGVGSGQSLTGLNISTASAATAAISTIDNAIEKVSSMRSKLGAMENRLNNTVNNLSNIVTNTQASRSRIQDTDYASETTALAKAQIISQAATAMLAQANQQPQSVLSLLK